MSPDLALRLPVADRYDLVGSLTTLRLGALDPTWQVSDHVVVHAFATPDGPATVAFVGDDGAVRVEGWGPGVGFLAPRLPDLLGARDAGGFHPPDPRIAELARRAAGVRLPLHPTPIEALIGVILQQRVSWKDAIRSWRRLCHAFGGPAPGPWPLTLPPDPARLAELGYAHLHPHGVEQKRAIAIREACQRRSAIDRLRDQPIGVAAVKLQALSGVGPWTAGMTAGKAFADPDAVVLGDLNLPHAVAWVLTGVERSTDEAMLRLLEPYRPHRWRVVQLLLSTGRGPPRKGPRIDGRWAPGA